MRGVGKGDLLEEECVHISLNTNFNLDLVCFKKITFLKSNFQTFSCLVSSRKLLSSNKNKNNHFPLGNYFLLSNFENIFLVFTSIIPYTNHTFFCLHITKNTQISNSQVILLTNLAFLLI